jgi:hypothetical protein
MKPGFGNISKGFWVLLVFSDFFYKKKFITRLCTILYVGRKTTAPLKTKNSKTRATKNQKRTRRASPVTSGAFVGALEMSFPHYCTGLSPSDWRGRCAVESREPQAFLKLEKSMTAACPVARETATRSRRSCRKTAKRLSSSPPATERIANERSQVPCAPLTNPDEY